MSTSTMSMDNPCPHVTRIEAIRARLHGDSAVLDHLAECS